MEAYRTENPLSRADSFRRGHVDGQRQARKPDEEAEGLHKEYTRMDSPSASNAQPGIDNLFFR